MEMHQPQQLMESYYAVYNSEQEEVDTDLYEQVVEYLVSEGYVEDVEEADALIEELSDDEIDGIIDEANRGDDYATRGLPDSHARMIKQKRRNADFNAGATHKRALRLNPAQRGELNRMSSAEDVAARYDSITRQRSNRNTRGRNSMREQLDTYDLVLDYLMTEGFADDESAATQIMAHMSDEWRDEIVEAKMEAGKSEYEKNRIRGERYADSIGRIEDYKKMGSSAPNWVAAQRRRNTKANRGIRG